MKIVNMHHEKLFEGNVIILLGAGLQVVNL
jgi:hypothetical protein